MKHEDKILDAIMIKNGDLRSQSTLFTKQCMIEYAESVRVSRSLSAVPSEEEIESFRKLSREKMLDRCGTLTEKERYQLGNWFDTGFETANNFIKRGIAG